MQIQILSSIIALGHLITPAASHAINLAPPPSHEIDLDTPPSFTLRQIAYLQYETSPYTPTSQPNTTQLVFEVLNSIDDIPVSTGCACQNVNWADDSNHWYSCLDREIVGEEGSKEYSVKTSVLVENWEDWRVKINQTWVCEERISRSQVSSLTLTPTCTENKIGSQYIKECTAPDVVVSATVTTA
ncbi:hypothetical protein HD806DRAFT_534750 [Xylariaceae sp. AK1471]|nr:hypothetical protein HD806DRAFT_534750 [Xylariaceae sp. AK1471]